MVWISTISGAKTENIFYVINKWKFKSDILVIFKHCSFLCVIAEVLWLKKKTKKKKKCFKSQFSYVSFVSLITKCNKLSIENSNCDTLHFHKFFFCKTRARWRGRRWALLLIISCMIREKWLQNLLGHPVLHSKQVLFLRDEASGGGCGAHKSFARLEGVHTLRH